MCLQDFQLLSTAMAPSTLQLQKTAPKYTLEFFPSVFCSFGSIQQQSTTQNLLHMCKWNHVPFKVHQQYFPHKAFQILNMLILLSRLPAESIAPSTMFLQLQDSKQFFHITFLNFFFFFKFCGHTLQDVGSQFPAQGSNLCPLQQKHQILNTRPPGKFLLHHFNQLFIQYIFHSNLKFS